jgi:hypothetical protein
MVLSLAQQTVNLARMNPKKGDHNQKHQRRIKNINKHFCRQQIPVLALQILNHTEDGSDQDEHTRDMQAHHVFAPGNVCLHRLWCGPFADAVLEVDGADEEKAEEDQL